SPVEFAQDLGAFPAGVAEDLTQDGLSLRRSLGIRAAHVVGGENQKEQGFVVAHRESPDHAPGCGVGEVDEFITRLVTLGLECRDSVAEIDFKSRFQAEYQISHRRMDAPRTDEQVELS